MAKTPYSHISNEIKISVFPVYLESQSSPDENHFLWAYHVCIENMRDETIQLKTRYWQITDSLGRTQEVRGGGVIGEQPILDPGEIFEYTSDTPLSTPSGVMVGSYKMEAECGDMFDVQIPPFSLDSPYQNFSVN